MLLFNPYRRLSFHPIVEDRLLFTKTTRLEKDEAIVLVNPFDATLEMALYYRVPLESSATSMAAAAMEFEYEHDRYTRLFDEARRELSETNRIQGFKALLIANTCWHASNTYVWISNSDVKLLMEKGV